MQPSVGREEDDDDTIRIMTAECVTCKHLPCNRQMVIYEVWRDRELENNNIIKKYYSPFFLKFFNLSDRTDFFEPKSYY